MRRRRSGKVAFDQKVIQDVGMAALAVRIIPMVLNNFIPLDQTLYTVAGAGGGYVAGTMMKNKTLANASIALGLVEFVAPVIENLIGGFGSPMTPIVTPGNTKMMPPVKAITTISDYMTLNDYVSSPNSMSLDHYKDSY